MDLKTDAAIHGSGAQVNELKGRRDRGHLEQQNTDLRPGNGEHFFIRSVVEATDRCVVHACGVMWPAMRCKAVSSFAVRTPFPVLITA